MTASAWEYFSEEELRCRHCGANHMKDSFMRKMVALRKYCDFPFKVSSGFRCPDYNSSISSTGRVGPHTTGQAMDIVVSGARALELISAARGFGITGIGIDQKGPIEKRFIHLDDLDNDASIPRQRPWVWTY